MKEKRPKGFLKTKEKAKKYLKDKNKAADLVTNAIKKSKKNENRLSKVWNDLQTMIRLLKAWIKGEYKEIPNKTILLIITAVVYFVNPFDVIPDFFLVTGFIDDATIIGFVINSILEDINKFKTWEKKRKEEV